MASLVSELAHLAFPQDLLFHVAYVPLTSLMLELAHLAFSQDLHVLVHVAVRYFFNHPPVGAPGDLRLEITPPIFVFADVEAECAARFRGLVQLFASRD